MIPGPSRHPREASGGRAIGGRAIGGRASGGRSSGGRWVVRVLALLTVLLVPTLQARADEAEVLRVRFLSGDEALRASVLKGLEGYPAQVGAVLGPVFGDRTVRAPAAHAAAWLADRAPKDREPLLVDEVFTRADGDPAFVEEVRRFTRPSAAASACSTPPRP